MKVNVRWIYACILISLFIGVLLSAATLGRRLTVHNHQTETRQNARLSALSDSLNGFDPKPQEITEPYRILFVGDIMLGRYVETLMREKGKRYPIEKIQDFLKSEKWDTVVGNLEGPIQASHVPTPSGTVRFSFSTDKAEWLADAGFDVVSLANNHTWDFGQDVLDETRQHLKKVGVDHFGDPIKEVAGFEHVLEIPGNNIVLLGFNMIHPNFSYENMYVAMETTREQYPDELKIVMMHWGNEYQSKSHTWQQLAAHNLIDRGADAIIGAHPHVVQEVEEYKGKQIYYSLGNFIFDQYFSDEVQEGQMVSLEVHNGKMSFETHTVKSELSQVSLVEKEDEKDEEIVQE